MRFSNAWLYSLMRLTNECGWFMSNDALQKQTTEPKQKRKSSKYYCVNQKYRCIELNSFQTHLRHHKNKILQIPFPPYRQTMKNTLEIKKKNGDGKINYSREQILAEFFSLLFSACHDRHGLYNRKQGNNVSDTLRTNNQMKRYYVLAIWHVAEN